MEKIAGNFGVISRFTRSSALGARWRPRRTIEGRRQKRRLPSSRALPCCLILPCWSRPGAPRASFMGTSDKLRGNFCGRRLGSTDFRLWIFCGSAGEKPHRLNRLRKKAPTPFCHSERSEESLFLFMELNRREILRFAQNDKINYFFRSLFSLWGWSMQGPKPQAEACATKFYNQLGFAASLPYLCAGTMGLQSHRLQSVGFGSCMDETPQT